MPRLLSIGIISCLLTGLGALGAGPAGANCIRGEVAIHWSGHPDQTVWPESYCFQETGSGDSTTVTVDQNKGGIPPGYPSGVRVKVWLPL